MNIEYFETYAFFLDLISLPPQISIRGSATYTTEAENKTKQGNF
jgi:hypothetical protein